MKIGIFGTGAFGLALSSILSENNKIDMWTKFEDEKTLLENNRCNDKVLDGYILNDNINITNSIEECIKEKDLLIVALPSIYITDLFKEMKNYITNQNILIASKGMTDENLLITDAIDKYLNTTNYGVLGGPNFASDLITKNPVAFTISTKSEHLKDITYKIFKTDYTKIQYTDDYISVEYLGILKNIYAIILGMLDGLETTSSTKAFYINYAIYEIAEIIEKLGGRKSNVLTYAGIGDLLLTATSNKSRNYQYGLLLGKNTDIEVLTEYLKNNTVEGYNNLDKILTLLNSNNINNILIKELNNIINENEDPKNILKVLIKK